MTAGTALMNRAMLALSAAGATVWRNNTGVGWAGKSFALGPGQTYKAHGRERIVLSAHPLHAGLCEGSPDLIGFHTVTITPDMAGQQIAVFHGWEVKSGSGRLTRAQAMFLNHLNSNGAHGAVIRDITDISTALFGK